MGWGEHGRRVRRQRWGSEEAMCMDYGERQRLAWLVKRGVYVSEWWMYDEDKILCGLCRCLFFNESKYSNGKVSLGGKLKLLVEWKELTNSDFILCLPFLSQHPVRKWPRKNHLQVSVNSCLLVLIFNNQSKFTGEFFKVFALSILFFTREWNTLLHVTGIPVTGDSGERHI